MLTVETRHAIDPETARGFDTETLRQHFHVGEEIEAEVTNIDSREKKIGLSVRALRRSEERAEMESYLSREGEQGRFSLEDVMSRDLQSRVGGGDKSKLDG